MKRLISSLLALLACTCSAGELVRYRIHAIDPRGVHFTDKNIPIFHDDKRADIIGIRELTVEESSILNALLVKELSPNTDVPLCGHFPGYAVEVREGKNQGSMVTLCGTCLTWAKPGGLFALSGREALAYLDQLLPLPDVFRKLPDGKIFVMDKTVPFFAVKPSE